MLGSRLAAIAFLVGVVLLQQLPTLPHCSVSLLLFISLPLSFWFVPLRIPLWCLNGFLYALWVASSILSHELPESLAGKDLWVEGVISSIPEQTQYGQRFEFEVLDWPDIENAESLPEKLRLSEYGSLPEVAVGERWRLLLRLKPAHGFHNPGGFDYEAWLFRKQIRATGYVREDEAKQLLGKQWSPEFWLHEQRKALADRIDEVLADSSYRGMVKALALGLRDDISDAQWQQLLHSGTNHLMAISGLHVGIVAGLVFFLMRWLWSRSSRLVGWQPAPQVAALAAILAALLYAAMAGFSIPTQRALVMVTAFMLAIILRRFRRPVDALLLALMAVLVIDPLAVMDAGFWLSFAAVTFILFGMSGRLGLTGLWWRWGHVHLLLAITLLPLTLFLFAQASVVAPVANLIAVPVVSVLVVPLVLLATTMLFVWPSLAGLLLAWVDLIFQFMWPGLEWLTQLPLAHVSYALPNDWLLLPLILGVLWFLAPYGWPARWLGLLWVTGALLWPFPRPQMGEAWLSLLDVGQGLAAVVQTQNHVLVFDTGPRFSDSFDTGKSVVLPFLLQAGWSEVDSLVVSHGDNDHIGGAESLLAGMPVRSLYSGTPEKLLAHDPVRCEAGQAWYWDGVEFEMLHPSAGYAGTGNDGSCVLRIKNGQGAILLTGDIELKAEKRLIRDVENKLRAELLVVPHHGSKTSSSKEFIAVVSPRWALFPVGYRNRFGLPRQAVIERYRDAGVKLRSTAYQGGITVALGAHGVSAPKGFRTTRRHYWTHVPEQGLVKSLN